jgi:hypothetical protein
VAQVGLEVGYGLAGGGGVEGEAREELLGAGARDQGDLDEFGRDPVQIAAPLLKQRWDASEACAHGFGGVGAWASQQVVQAVQCLFEIKGGSAVGRSTVESD